MYTEEIYRNKEYFVTTTLEQREANGKAFWDRMAIEIV